MKKRLRIGVIFGGRSGEHEVSLVSAESILRALDKSKYEVIPIGITKEGRWLTSGQPLRTLKAGQFKELQSDRLITPDATQHRLVKITDRRFATQKLKSKKIDIIFPALHGTYGEDGTIQGLLELANIPYIGANVLSSSVNMDKVVQKQLFRDGGLPVVKFIHFLSKNWATQKKEILKNTSKLGYPVFVKPANLGSSVGISKAHTPAELSRAVLYALKYDRKIIVEKAVNRPREIEVAVLGNDSPRASVPGEIVASNEFYDYDAKYVDGLSKALIPAPLAKKTVQRIRQLAITAFKTTDCSGMARVDFLLTRNNKIYLSEINTIPGFTSISMYPKLWAATGLPYARLLDELIKLAIERHQEKSKLLTSYQPKSKWYQE